MGNALCPLISSLVLYKHFCELGLIFNKDIMVTGYADDNSIFMTEYGYQFLCKKLNVNKITVEILSNFINNTYKGIIVEADKSGFVKYKSH
jgi:hypothetical protein